MAVHLLQRAGQPIDEPLLAVIVVFAEGSIRREMRTRRLHGLRRKEIALQAQ